ncbi:CHAT domain-containing protein [Sorangium sp. So ce260]|uniref:CHAT domain-containing tetratricopeptide repeat protein n=1 Tax=Sorangium sp. So ce260 TaxID=3133291 RepID=UPI003F5E0334
MRLGGWIGGATSLLVIWLALAASARAAEPRGAVLGPGDATASLWLSDFEDYARAIRAAESSVARLEERRARSDHLASDAVANLNYNLALSLVELGAARMGSGDYAGAEPPLTRAIDVAESHVAEKPEVMSDRRSVLVRALTVLGELRMKQGDLDDAEALLLRATSLYVEARDRSMHAADFGALDSLARLLLAKADHRRAGAILSTPPAGSDSRSYIDLTRAELEIARAEYGRAEDRLERHLKKSSVDGPSVARCLQDLADIHAEAGDPALARPLLERAIGILEKVIGAEHPSLAAALDRLAAVKLLLGAEPSEVVPLVERALALRDKKLGTGHVGRTTSLMLRGDLALRRRDRAAAERAYREALALRERRLGDRHPGVAEALAALGQLREEGGEPEAAEPLYRRALAIEEAAFGPHHPRVARALQRLGRLRLDQGDLGDARGLLARGADIQDRRALALLPTASEEQRTAFVSALRDDTDLLLSLHADSAPSDPEAARLAFTAVLRRKGITLDAAADRLAALRDRSSADDTVLLKQFVSIQSQIVDLAVRLPSSQQPDELHAAIDALERQKEAIEEEIGRRGAALRIDDEPVTLDGVRAALPKGAALVEIVVRRPRVPGRDSEASDERFAAPRAPPAAARAPLAASLAPLAVPLVPPAAPLAASLAPPSAASRAPQGPPSAASRAPLAWGAPRYAAYVLHADGRIAWADLGEAASVDARAADLRRAFAQPHRDPQRPARALDERVMQPLRALLGGARWLFLSPDGELNLVPFGALVDEHGRYLLEHGSFTYLTSGRDLLRSHHHDPRRAEPGLPALIVGAPEFGSATRHARFRREAPADAAPHRRSIDMRALLFPALPGTLPEVTSIAQWFPGATVLTGLDAAEEALKAAAHPRILHLATHGFFLPDMDHATGAAGENPLLRSGLALASANRPHDGPEDGVLTALEASALDLYGTQLVVLSACETGLGEVKRSDGVYGLRRALVLAGAETQVMSLWKIQDRETRNLMASYYEKLAAGGGRVEAMRQAQLEMRSRPETAHPFYWAAFIVSGDGTALDGREVAPRLAPAAASPSVPSLPPGPRGCACDSAGTGASSATAANAATAALLALGALAARLRRPGVGRAGGARDAALSTTANPEKAGPRSRWPWRMRRK